MTKTEADAVFAHYDEIGLASPGTRCVTTDDVEASPSSQGGIVTLVQGTQLRVVSSLGGLISADAVQGAGILRVVISGEEFHKIERVGEDPSDAEEPADPDPLLGESASSVLDGCTGLKLAVLALMTRGLREPDAGGISGEPPPFASLQTVADDPMMP